MKQIYQGLCGLEISFQCALPSHILNILAAAKEAGSGKITIGNSELLVAPTGARGYAYRFDTDMASWLASNSNNPELWNIHATIKAKALVLYGYSEIKNRISDFLNDELEAISPEILFTLPERISGFSYCFDFIAEGFWPNINQFIAPNRTYKKFNSEIITFGKMPNKRISIFKIRNPENYWWDIWELEKEKFKKEIIRIVISAGKKELNKSNIRTFRDLEKKTKSLIISILNSTYYSKNNSPEIADFWKNMSRSVKLEALIPGVLDLFSGEW